MKSPFKVYLGDKPMTLPIEDEKRASLAYTLLYAIGEENSVTMYGPEIDPENLSVMDADGMPVDFIPDPEWYGSQIQDCEYMVAIRLKTAAQTGINYEDIGPELNTYTVIADGMDPHQDDLVPVTYDKDKAAEMLNFLKYGLDPSVELCGKHTDHNSHKYTLIPVTADVLHVVDYRDKKVVDVKDEPDWVKGQMDPAVVVLDDGQDFADAVAQIQVEGQTMEQ